MKHKKTLLFLLCSLVKMSFLSSSLMKNLQLFVAAEINSSQLFFTVISD